MNAAERFRAAIEVRDLDAMMAPFAPNARFYSPVKFAPIEGTAAIRVLLGVIVETFEDFRYVGELTGEVDHFTGNAAGNDADPAHVLVFRARVGDAAIHGIDLIHLSADDEIDEFTVMVRPQSALLALSAAVLAGLQKVGAS
jgi:limonene-1,2-epoxide hydrolase